VVIRFHFAYSSRSAFAFDLERGDREAHRQTTSSSIKNTARIACHRIHSPCLLHLMGQDQCLNPKGRPTNFNLTIRACYILTTVSIGAPAIDKTLRATEMLFNFSDRELHPDGMNKVALQGGTSIRHLQPPTAPFHLLQEILRFADCFPNLAGSVFDLTLSFPAVPLAFPLIEWNKLSVWPIHPGRDQS